LPAEAIEPHPARPALAGRGRFAFYDHAAVFDHAAGRWYAVAVEWPGQHSSVAHRLNVIREMLRRADAPPLHEPPVPFTSTPLANMSRSAYLRKVARAKRYIEDGDIYEVNLSQRFTAGTNASPLDLYRRLREASPSWYGAFLQYADGAILSASPELFMELREGRVVTRPIKGTRPRTGDPGRDAQYRRALARSEKDRAELTMIVDLLRNDLGRVCEYGSVRVREAAAIEEHTTVFHQVATIDGNLAAGKTWVDLLGASFPGGSVTGAPKIRAMQIIRELEPTPRGVYCGAIGWIGLSGDATLNLAIRTMIHRRDTVYLHAGGAIVADSEPEAEYDETITKLAGMLAALNAESPAACEVLRQPVAAA
jgi:para-aminobenzoate synthetase component 1